ncbi:MAG TPA: hypothetical protein VFW98_08350 [Gemmatimonadaceae bacterium]|nr:hypothetical protein [Gemmatimonadaceae bacterium]
MPGAPTLAVGYTIDPAKLTGASERSADLRPAWIEGVQPIITEFLTQRFATEGAWMTDAPWAPLAPATVELRKRPGHGRGGIGRDLNRMWASFVKSAGSTAAPNGLLLIAPERYERGSSLPYAQWFHAGYMSKTKPVQYEGQDGELHWTFVRRKAPKRIPARPIIPDPLPPALVDQVEAVVSAYVARGVTT